MRSAALKSGLTLLFLDILGLVAFYNVAHYLRLQNWIALNSAQLWVLVLIAILSLYVMDVYRTEEPETRSRLPLNTFSAVIVAAIASVFFVYTIGISEFAPIFGRGVLPVAMALFAIWAPWWRWLLSRMRQKSVNTLYWLVIAREGEFDRFSKDNAAKVPAMRFTRFDTNDPVQVFDQWLRDNPHRSGLVFENNALLQPELTRSMMELRMQGVPILTMSEFYEQYWLKLPVLHLQDGWFIQSRGFNLVHDHVGLRLKRLVDMVIAIAGLVILSPLLLLIALLVRVTSPGKALYRQKRVGRSGKEFSLYKFRTMISNAEADGARWAERNDPRITPLGNGCDHPH